MMTGIRNARICRYADEALKEFQTGYQPDVALIAPDLKNGIHGIKLIEKIRNSFETGKGKEIPILLLVSRLDKAMLRHACRTGVEGAIRKPLDHAKIGRIILAAIKTPRRFIAVRDYFGPERRIADDPAYSGPERRTDLGEHETIATKVRRDEKPKSPPTPAPAAQASKQEKPKQTKEPALVKDPNITPISEYELPESRVDKVAVKPKGGKIVADDEPFPEAEKPKPVVKPQPVAKPKPQPPQEARPEPAAKPKPAATAAVPTQKPKPVPPKPAAKPKQEGKGVEAAAPAKPAKPKEEAREEVEIVDIDEALRNHRLWVDSAGREGEAIVVERANLRGADLEAADLTGVSLIQANFTEAKMTEIVLRKANLTGAVFAKANLTGANLAVARLRRANLVGARLDRAVLRGADLSGAKFKGASLLRTDLSSANLAKADLSGANLSATIGLIQEQVDRAYLDSKTALPNGLKVNPAALARSAKAGLTGLTSKATKRPVKG